MILEFRDVNGKYMFSCMESSADLMFKFLAKNDDIVCETRMFKGKAVNCFITTNEIGTGGKTNDFEFLIQPGDYVKIIK